MTTDLEKKMKELKYIWIRKEAKYICRKGDGMDKTKGKANEKMKIHVDMTKQLENGTDENKSARRGGIVKIHLEEKKRNDIKCILM